MRKRRPVQPSRTLDVGDSITYRPSAGWFVYALRDPQTDAVRYIGQCRLPMSRLEHHISEALDPDADIAPSSGARRDWIRGLAREGLYPSLVILDVASSAADAVRKETTQILEHRDALLNGGWQGRDYKATYARIAERRAAAYERWGGPPVGYYTVAAAAKTLGVSRQRLYQILGKAPARAKKVGRGRLLTVAAVDRLRARRRSVTGVDSP